MSHLFLYGIFFFLLVLINMWLSCCEISITASSSVKLGNLRRTGDPRIKKLLYLREHMGLTISSVLLVGTCFYTLMIAVFQQMIHPYLGQQGLFYMNFALSIFMTIYVELAPKILAYDYAEHLALRLSPIIFYITRTLKPFVYILDRLAYKSLTLIGFARTKRTESSIDHLKGAIALHASSGISTPYEAHMLDNILTLSHIYVSEVMIHRRDVFRLSCHMDVHVFIKKALQNTHTRIPLWKNQPDNIVSVCHTKRLVHLMQKKENITWEDIFQYSTKKAWFIPETVTIFSQLQQFRKRNELMACVVDEYGSFLGILTLEDVLEEIVGDIVDESDKNLVGVKMLSPKRFIAHGHVHIRDINRQYQWNLPDGSITLSGLIMDKIQSTAYVGATCSVGDLRLKVLSIRGHTIKKVEIIRTNI